MFEVGRAESRSLYRVKNEEHVGVCSRVKIHLDHSINCLLRESSLHSFIRSQQCSVASLLRSRFVRDKLDLLLKGAIRIEIFGHDFSRGRGVGVNFNLNHCFMYCMFSGAEIKIAV